MVYDSEDALDPDAGPLAGEPPPRKVRDHTYKIAATSAIALLILGTVVYHYAEDWSWVDSFYFCAIAVTTVGFGDLSPTTDFTKLFTVLYVGVGISLIGVVLNERLRRHASRAGSIHSDHQDD